MAVTENDFELLDAYLDDALDVGEVEALRVRLESDAELCGAMEQLRGERAMRKSIFAALEPDDAAVRAFVGTVRRSMRGRERFARFARPMRLLAALAACVAIGFFSRGLFDRPPAPGDAVVKSGPKVDVQPVTQYQVTLRDDAGRVVAVQRFDSIDKAREFAADLSRWQARSENLAGGKFVLTADRF